MKKKGFALLAGAVVLGFFASQKSFAQDNFLIERISSRSVSISHAYAHARGENLLVAGKVSRWHELHLPGHVDVAVYDPDGNLLAVEKAQLPGIMSQRKGRLDLPFSTQFKVIPPAGSLIRVRYHWLPAFLSEDFLPPKMSQLLVRWNAEQQGVLADCFSQKDPP